MGLILYGCVLIFIFYFFGVPQHIFTSEKWEISFVPHVDLFNFKLKNVPFLYLVLLVLPAEEQDNTKGG